MQVGGDEDDDGLPGFSESASVSELETVVRRMDDAALLHSYGVLSNVKLIRPSLWLEAIENEVRARGLRTLN